MSTTLSPRPLPGSLQTNRFLNQWLSIHAEGYVTMRPGKVEIGQGILTALRQIVAEELDLDLEKIRVQTAVTALSPNEGVTSGSLSIQDSGSAFRQVAAEVRELLLSKAAAHLSESVEQLSVKNGLIRSRSGASVSYWALTDEQLLNQEATGQASPKSAEEHVVVGTAAMRMDIPAKVTGVASYVQDMSMPGMVHGRICRPPSYEAELKSVNLEPVRVMPGVISVHRDGRFLGVVAEREEQAIRAQLALTRAAQWSEVPTLPPFNPRYLLKAKAQSECISQKGQVLFSPESSVHEAEYSRQFLAHASLAPSCAIALFEKDRYTVWTHSQGIYPLRREMAVVLGVEEDQVLVHHVEGAGCYGHNGADDVALEAALLARTLPGRAVRLQWMREEEFAWEPFSSAMVAKTRATLSAQGMITHWQMDVWSHGHSSRPGRSEGSNLLASWYLEKPFKRAQTSNPPLPGGGSHRNAIPIYEFANQQINNHLVPDPPIRSSALRGLGSQTNVFAIECFMDELALQAHCDPVSFRLRHVKDERARAVIEAVALMASWQSLQPSDGVTGRGVGFARYKNGAGYMAMIAEVQLAETLQVKNIWAAVDVGQIINSDGLKNQIEGGIIQSVSFVLKEEVKYDAMRITQANWEDYPVLNFTEIPQVQIQLINRPHLPALGAGEGTQGPVAAAIANALFHLSGTRLRDMPLTRERIMAAMA